LLWELLAAADVTDAIKPAEQVRLAVRLTGRAAIRPSLRSRKSLRSLAVGPFQLDDHLNGTLLPDHALRLVIRGDKRGGRSVRDVVRIDIE